jgi:protoporphyrinogen oxidase
VTSTRNLILGAGLAGLSAAFHLRDRETLLLEREREPGGLCRTREVEGFHFDCTGHLLHLEEGPVREMVLGLLPRVFRSVERRASVFSKGVFTGYPFQANTHGLPKEVVRECVAGFVESLMRTGREREPGNFRDWVLATFGEGIARHFMFPYNEKLYRVELEELECGWVSWSIPRPTLDEVIRGALGTEVRGLGYNARFLYPKKGGISCVPEAIASRCGTIRTGCSVRSVDPRQKRAVLENGEPVEYERLISTLPLNALLRILKPLPEGISRLAPERLRAVRVVNVNLGVDRPGVLPCHWAYFPEPEFPFYRVGSPTSYSDHVAPPGCSSLYVEVARRRDEPVDEAALQEEVLDGLRRARILRRSDRILARELVVLDPAYVVYDHFRRGALPGILRRLEEQEIFSIGRFGAWEYGSMESAMRQGRDTALRLASDGRSAAGGER